MKLLSLELKVSKAELFKQETPMRIIREGIIIIKTDDLNKRNYFLKNVVIDATKFPALLGLINISAVCHVEPMRSVNYQTFRHTTYSRSIRKDSFFTGSLR